MLTISKKSETETSKKDNNYVRDIAIVAVERGIKLDQMIEGMTQIALVKSETITNASDLLGIGKSTLYRWIEDYETSHPGFKQAIASHTLKVTVDGLDAIVILDEERLRLGDGLSPAYRNLREEGANTLLDLAKIAVEKGITLSDIEKYVVFVAMELYGDARDAGKALGIGKSTVYRKVAEYRDATRRTGIVQEALVLSHESLGKDLQSRNPSHRLAKMEIPGIEFQLSALRTRAQASYDTGTYTLVKSAYELAEIAVGLGLKVSEVQDCMLIILNDTEDDKLKAAKTIGMSKSTYYRELERLQIKSLPDFDKKTQEIGKIAISLEIKCTEFERAMIEVSYKYYFETVNAAKAIGMSKSTFYRFLNLYGITNDNNSLPGEDETHLSVREHDDEDLADLTTLSKGISDVVVVTPYKPRTGYFAPEIEDLKRFKIQNSVLEIIIQSADSATTLNRPLDAVVKLREAVSYLQKLTADVPKISREIKLCTLQVGLGNHYITLGMDDDAIASYCIASKALQQVAGELSANLSVKSYLANLCLAIAELKRKKRLDSRTETELAYHLLIEVFSSRKIKTASDFERIHYCLGLEQLYAGDKQKPVLLSARMVYQYMAEHGIDDVSFNPQVELEKVDAKLIKIQM
ncbi:TPA: hypothetical protein HA246_06130 [Candidatus Woesearchaeota archaeon]|nr:hypothetical protein [Candidatus Woesearchaeota archaeon]